MVEALLIAVVLVLALLIWKLDKLVIGKQDPSDSPLFPVVPDPWEDILSKDEQDEIFSDLYPLCVNCVHPDSAPIWICEKCGCPTGHYTPYMPFLYLYWQGWLFRSGVDGSVKLTTFKVIGILISAAAGYSIFFPFYLYRFIQSARGKHLIEPAKAETKQ